MTEGYTMKVRIDSAKAGRTFTGKDGLVQVYEVVAGGIIYDCMSEKCLTMIGQEVEFEVKQPSDPKYHPTMKLPSAGGGGKSWGSGGKTFVPSFKDTPTGAILSAKTMALSYAKDLASKFSDSRSTLTFEETIKNVEAAYPRLVTLLDLNSVPAAPAAPAGEKACSDAGERKLVLKLISEIQGMASMPAFGAWWNQNQPTIKALSQGEREMLMKEKAKKVESLEKKQAPVVDDEIPF
jgi:hypothetical protein